MGICGAGRILLYHNRAMDEICEIQNEADACMCLWLAIGNSGQYSDRLWGLVERDTIANRLANEVSRWSKFDITRAAGSTIIHIHVYIQSFRSKAVTGVRRNFGHSREPLLNDRPQPSLLDISTFLRYSCLRRPQIRHYGAHTTSRPGAGDATPTCHLQIGTGFEHVF
jgi:hypothetical protein